MVLPFYLSIATLLILLLFYIRKPLSFLQNSIIYMATVFIATQYLTLIRMEFHLIEKSSGHLDYVSFLLYRNLFIPAAAIIFCNFYLRLESGESKFGLFLATTLMMIVADWLNTSFGILKYTHWNMGLSGIVDALHLLIALGVMKMTLNIPVQESQTDENI
ncbi:MAG TPA: hypothetical protein DCR24_09895 [Bacillus bacterium]|nr:hypothetical protein [Bacillus sp. (in: firmicutes)]